MSTGASSSTFWRLACLPLALPLPLAAAAAACCLAAAAPFAGVLWSLIFVSMSWICSVRNCVYMSALDSSCSSWANLPWSRAAVAMGLAGSACMGGAAWADQQQACSTCMLVPTVQAL
jgi:hypothetical protein